MSVLDCIARIPQQLKQIKDQRDSRLAGLQTYLHQRKPIKEIIFVASGTSYNGAFTAKRFLETSCDLKVCLIYPNMFVNYDRTPNKDALYVVISQGGTTKLVYEAQQRLKDNGCSHVAITESLDSPIAKQADIAIEMGSGYEEYLYRTLGYSTTVATISMIGLMIAQTNQTLTKQQVEDIITDYEQLYTSLPTIQNQTLAWYHQHKFSLMKRPKAMIAGTNDLWPVAQEADIKLMEMVPMMTRSFELEEFIHGPQNAFDDATAFYLLSKKGEDDTKIQAIANFIKQEIGFCAIIGANTLDQQDLPLTITSKYFSTLEYITVMQVLAYQLAVDHGRDLSRGVNAQVKQYINKSVI